VLAGETKSAERRRSRNSIRLYFLYNYPGGLAAETSPNRLALFFFLTVPDLQTCGPVFSAGSGPPAFTFWDAQLFTPFFNCALRLITEVVGHGGHHLPLTREAAHERTGFFANYRVTSPMPLFFIPAGALGLLGEQWRIYRGGTLGAAAEE
jgi:hypothetical protein